MGMNKITQEKYSMQRDRRKTKKEGLWKPAGGERAHSRMTNMAGAEAQ
jgi:hypothetical protein